MMENIYILNKCNDKQDDTTKNAAHKHHEMILNNKDIDSLKNFNSDYKNKMIDELNIHESKFPDEVTISTMTIICKIDTEFNVKNIGQYLELSYGKIHSVNFGDAPETNNVIMKKKKKKKKTNNEQNNNEKNNDEPDVDKPNKKRKKHFFNQVSVTIKSPTGKLINIKLFLNGSIHMTGCKNFSHTMEALHCLFDELKKSKYIYSTTKKKIIEKPFVKNKDALVIDKLFKMKVVMINTNFDIDYVVSRDKLYEFTKNNDIVASYDPNVHACVNIKCKYKKKKISVFVFESGSIIITGVSNSDHVNYAYEFINKLLLSNYENFVIQNILTESLIDLMLQ